VVAELAFAPGVRSIAAATSTHLRKTDTELHVTLLPLASPYKTWALAALCEELTRLDSTFPGTNLKMVFHVQQALRAS
jgi:hypothetical protein